MENPETQNKPGQELETLRTFQSDVQKIVQEGETSLSKIAIAENEKKSGDNFYQTENLSDNSKSSKIIIWISIILFVLGAGILTYFFISANNKKNEIVPALNANPILIADSEKKFSISGLSKSQLTQTITTEKNNGRIPLSSIERILLTETNGQATSEISISNFLTLLNSKIPPELLRSFDNKFVLGFHSFKENEPFLVLKINYYQNAFAGMLSWEKDMEEDLGPIFIRPELALAASTTADVLNNKRIFHDTVLRNFDTRALKKTDGVIILLYSFINKNTLIITTNPDTLAEVSRRMLAGRLIQ